MAPWTGPRHKTWAANTNVATVAIAILFGTWLIWEIVGTAPPLLAQLLGPATGIWFASVAGDQKKKQEAVSDKADRATHRVEEIEHRMGESNTRADAAERRADAAESRADESESRESGWSRHQDHSDDNGGRHEHG